LKKLFQETNFFLQLTIIMIILALSFCAVLTTATNSTYNGTYYECFDNADCKREYDHRDYCYAGTCTSRCPPGYTQINSGTDGDFFCECDADKGLETDGFFPYPFKALKIPKCKCERDFCVVTVRSTGIGYTDGLVPHGAPPNCKVKQGEIPNVLTEFSFYLVLVTMTLFLLVNCRSCSGVIYDFHRYYALYIIGSMAVIVFVNTVYPFTAGFTRSMAFGIVAHNSAEWNLLLRLHFGKYASVRNKSNVCVVVYYIIMLLAMSTLPLHPLLYFSMIQGGFLDWTFICFIYAAGSSMQKEEKWDYAFHGCCKSVHSRFVWWYGTAAVVHLLSVEILFTGFILNNPRLIGAGGFLLVPMFFCYTIWVYGEERFMLFCGPRLFMNYNKNYTENTHFLLVPFRHTTRVVDILWQKFVSGSQPLRDAGVELKNITPDNYATENDVIRMEDVVEENEITPLHVEDCESFKFGIAEDVKKCDYRVCCSCCAWIPLYWVAAFLFISINVAIVNFFPRLFPANGCNSDYDYGAWTRLD